MREQGWHILRALAQCWCIQRQHIEPVIQIFSEPPGFNFGFQIAVRRCHYPHIHFHRFQSPDRVDRALLQNTQQLDLHVQRQITDLVQENGAAVGQFKAPNAVGHGTREGALAMTKQFTF